MHEPALDEESLALREPKRPSLTLDRLASFRLTYAAIFLLVILYVFSVRGVEQLLDRHFRIVVAEAIRVDPADGLIRWRIQNRLDQAVRQSRWVRIGGVRVTAIVLGADGLTPLYVGGRALASPAGLDPLAGTEKEERLLPASAEIVTSVPHNALLANGILVAYAVPLILALFLRSRALARREEEQLRAAVEARDSSAARASGIEEELDSVRRRLQEVDPAGEGHSEEIHALEEERTRLRAQLHELAQREHQLRSAQSHELEEERQTLEDLLDEALVDLGQKDEEISSLQARLKKASRAAPATGRGRESIQVARRLRTLYKNIEIDDRAVEHLVALRDESMKLKAEESLKRLSEETESAPVRRKVGGLPAHLSIFEIGFGGKGRVYYTAGKQRRFRILSVGAKNTQKQDLEYLSRLPRD